MPKVPLTATKDFTYMTRRLTAGDAFEARNGLEAKILTRVRKVAEAPKAKPKAAPKVIGDAEVYLPDEGQPKPVAKLAAKKAPAKRKAKAKK